MKAATTKLSLPRTCDDVLKDLATEYNAACKELHETVEKVRALMHDEFVANGGCTTCRGRGWVVVWDTLDSLSGCYAEYGSCSNPECTAETRARTGLDSSCSKYDRNRGVGDPVEQHPAYRAVVPALQNVVDALDRKVQDAKAKAAIKKGDKVVVTKGRKAPIGFVGTYFWSKDSEWGLRIGVKNDAGEVAWTYLNNVAKLA